MPYVPKSFYRFDSNILTNQLSGTEFSIKLPNEAWGIVKPGDGIVIAKWVESQSTAKVEKIGIVVECDSASSSAKALMHNLSADLVPNPGGRQFWRKPFFKFAKSVVDRYSLREWFSKHFNYLEPTFSGLASSRTTNHKHGKSPTGGYVYVVGSDHGYKIGKTVNLKNRYKLFEVKLPFHIWLESYAWFENYSEAESNFHRVFANKRKEGEWFDLSASDLEYIKRQGEPVNLSGF